MRRIVGTTGILLVMTVCGTSAHDVQPEQAFLFKRVDPRSGLALLAPVTPVWLGVQSAEGSRVLVDNDVLRCRAEVISRPIGADGALSSETSLVCEGGRRLVVKGILFDGR